MNNWQEKVSAFHKKFGFPVRTKPELISSHQLTKRNEWVDDELAEMENGQSDGDIKEVADGIVDAIYFLVGTAVEMGIDLDPLFAEVHRTNMNKDGGATRSDGKLLKPEGWTPPDLDTLLRQQGWEP